MPVAAQEAQYTGQKNPSPDFTENFHLRHCRDPKIGWCYTNHQRFPRLISYESSREKMQRMAKIHGIRDPRRLWTPPHPPRAAKYLTKPMLHRTRFHEFRCQISIDRIRKPSTFPSSLIAMGPLQPLLNDWHCTLGSYYTPNVFMRQKVVMCHCGMRSGLTRETLRRTKNVSLCVERHGALQQM